MSAKRPAKRPVEALRGNTNAAGRRYRPHSGAAPWMVALRDRPNARTHGSHVVERELRELRRHGLDPASPVYAIYRDVRAELVGSLGGEEHLSAQELWLVDEATWTRLLLMYVNTWLAEQPALINPKSRELLPIIRQKQGLVVSLHRLLDALGLKRRTRDALTLAEYLREKANPTPTDDPSPIDITP